MTITVSVPDQLAAHAAARGLSVEELVEQLAEQALNTAAKHGFVPRHSYARTGGR